MLRTGGAYPSQRPSPQRPVARPVQAAPEPTGYRV